MRGVREVVMKGEWIIIVIIHCNCPRRSGTCSWRDRCSAGSCRCRRRPRSRTRRRGIWSRRRRRPRGTASPTCRWRWRTTWASWTRRRSAGGGRWSWTRPLRWRSRRTGAAGAAGPSSRRRSRCSWCRTRWVPPARTAGNSTGSTSQTLPLVSHYYSLLIAFISIISSIIWFVIVFELVIIRVRIYMHL